MKIQATAALCLFACGTLMASGERNQQKGDDAENPQAATFQKIVGGRSFDAAKRVIKQEGGYLVVGRTASHGEGDTDLSVVSLDMKGEVIWNNHYGAEDSEEGNDIVATADGGSLVVGYAEVSGEYGATKDIWVVKLDNTGKVAWTKYYGSPHAIEEALAVTETADGNFLLVGNVIPIQDDASSNIIAIKIDPLGKVIWEKQYGGLANEEGNDVIKTDEGFAIVGSTESFGEGRWDLWVVRTDADGNELQSHALGGKDNEMGNVIIQAKDGSFVVAGYSYSFAVSSLDAWVVKFDKSGQRQWAKSFGGLSTDEAFGLQQTDDGGFVMAGYTEVYVPNAELENTSLEAHNMMLVKLKANGDKEWERSIGGDKNQNGFWLEKSHTGGWIIVGSTDALPHTGVDMLIVTVNAQGMAD